MLLPDFLIAHPNGEVHLAGHRIGLYHFLHYYNEGYSAEMIAGQFPTLPLALVYKVIAFYLENTAEVDDYTAGYRAELDRLRAEGSHAPSLVELRRRMAARLLAEPASADRA